MIADWNLLGIKVPFPVPDAPQNSNVNDDTNLPDGAWETVYTNLAIRIGPTIGRQVSVETKQIAKAGYDALLIMAAQPYEMQFPNTLPIGQGRSPGVARIGRMFGRRVAVYRPILRLLLTIFRRGMIVEINQINRVSTVTAQDLVYIFSNWNSNGAAAPMSVLQTFFQANLTAPDGKVTQYAAPNASGFNVIVAQNQTWLLLTPLGAYAAGEITLPNNPVDKSECLVCTTQAVTALTITPGVGSNGSNQQVVGAPTTLAAGAHFKLRFDFVTQTWYGV